MIQLQNSAFVFLTLHMNLNVLNETLSIDLELNALACI